MSPGADLFARYAHAPNALGYCGPSSGVRGTDDEVRAAARHFSGAWPYLQVLARLTGTADPLDAGLVEAYWLGRDLGVDPARFGAELLAAIGPRAGHYWKHLTPELLASGAPDHAFHVFGVYPWSRLLDAGPEPLHVLDRCRIRWGVVVGRDDDGVEVESSHLAWDGSELGLGSPTPERIPAANVQVEIEVGDEVALHWEYLCDHLDGTQRESLQQSTRRELARLGSAVG